MNQLKFSLDDIKNDHCIKDFIRSKKLELPQYMNLRGGLETTQIISHYSKKVLMDLFLNFQPPLDF